MVRNFLVACAVIVSAFLSGCSGGGQGTAGMTVSDAPVDDYSHVNVTFSRAAIHMAGSGGDDANSTAGWIEIVNTTRTVDLIALHKNDTSAALGFAKVDAGRYTQVRVYVDKVVATKASDGSEVTMTVPSGMLRTSKSFEVRAGGNTTLDLEIDLNRSINCNNNGCTFSPVLGKVNATEA